MVLWMTSPCRKRVRALTKPGNSCDFCVKCGGEGIGLWKFWTIRNTTTPGALHGWMYLWTYSECTLSPFSKDHQKLQYAACMTLLKRVVRLAFCAQETYLLRNWTPLWGRFLLECQGQGRELFQGAFFFQLRGIAGIAKGAGNLNSQRLKDL